jgi:phosphonate transport system substrate-binding protein
VQDLPSVSFRFRIIAMESNETISFGIVLSTDDELRTAAVQKFCQVLSQQLNKTVEPRCVVSPALLAEALHQSEVQLAWVSPTLLVLSPLLNEVTPLLCTMREGVSFYHAALFVPKNSAITNPQQLKGTRVAWVATSSAAGYIIPRISLVRHGLSLNGLFREEIFCDSHQGVCRAVMSGRADVGATFAVFAKGNPDSPLVRSGFLESGVNANIIDVAGPIPSDAFVSSREVSPELRLALSAGLRALSLQEEAQEAMLTLFGSCQFKPFSVQAFEELSSLINSAKELGALTEKNNEPEPPTDA